MKHAQYIKSPAEGYPLSKMTAATSEPAAKLVRARPEYLIVVIALPLINFRRDRHNVHADNGHRTIRHKFGTKESGSGPADEEKIQWLRCDRVQHKWRSKKIVK